MSAVDFNGRVAIVTGAGGGLGRTYAMDLAKRGAAVVVNDLGGSFDGQGSSHNMADQVVEEIRAAGGKAVANYDSVGTRAGGEGIVQSALDAFGRVDVVINNAGHLRNAAFDEIDDEILDSLINVHLKGAIYVTQPAYKVMKQQGYGRVVFASSAAGAFGNPQQGAYAAAKAGLLGVMNVLSLEGKQHGVLCNALLPTANSRMAAAMDPKQLEAFGAQYAAFGEQLGNAYLPDFVTPLVVYLASEACTSTHGIYSASVGHYARAFIAVNDGWTGPREAPASADELASHFQQIAEIGEFSIPESLSDEFAIIQRNFSKSR
ncbi:SDR family NAD(P)-dependent oxidoreductase [Pseudomonas nicosulfuronedens]|uniref:SDR family NAD(P)-dependent oxidoreductase n=1 Tax=Pseudomonas nicosulfuronedens TaxID=2571105 RepID=A0A5R9QNN6_9PSED|nr:MULTISPECIES: SDR family NAD(P)-dependent oxidoreductase [Pseudomonas]TLX71311.1 SDR family NAD(P)-dependent oxidoreductase [Pseudomonas nicosulfuronedens]